MPIWLLILSTCIVAGALVMTLVNLHFYRRQPRSATQREPETRVSVCIPARNEQANIADCIRSVLASDHPAVEVLVYDDQSTDNTPRIIDTLAAADARVCRVPTRPMPESGGWVGKQWACQQLGAAAGGEFIVFIDADVRLQPPCLTLALAHARSLRASLISTFPRQITGTLAEHLLVPLIHFILLSYLPFARMRSSRDPAASAACGQFIMVARAPYLAVGGHAAVRDSMHDGVKLPRIFRRNNHHTDLFDGTEVCSCRMYTGLAQTWRGFAKNAYEGLGSPALLIFITALHMVGYIVPIAAIALMAWRGQWPLPESALALSACAAMLAHRFLLAIRFKQSMLGAALHPVGVIFMAAVQWWSYLLSLRGRRQWRGRTLSTPSGLDHSASETQPAPGAAAS